MAYEIEWDGLEELGSTLTKAIAKSETQVKQVIYNNTEKGKAKAKELAPVDTWFMHDEIYSVSFGLTGEIISNAGYSGFVNFGTRFMPAQPFMTDMFEWVVEYLEKDIKDVAKGLFK